MEKVTQSYTRSRFENNQSFASKVKDVLHVLVLIGGLSYGVRKLWKKHISFWLYGPQAREQSNAEKISASSKDILQAVENLQKIIANLQKTLERNQHLYQNDPNDCGPIQQLRKDVQAIKGMMLTSRSFPGPPSLIAPRLPSWQLEMCVTPGEEEQEQGEGGQETLGEEQEQEQETTLESSHQTNSSSSEIELISGESGEEGTVKEENNSEEDIWQHQ